MRTKSIERLDSLGVNLSVETGSSLTSGTSWADLRVLGHREETVLLRSEGSSAEEAVSTLWSDLEAISVALVGVSQERRGVRRKRPVTVVLGEVATLEDQIEAVESRCERLEEENDRLSARVDHLELAVDRLRVEPERLEALLHEAGEAILPLERFASLVLDSDYTSVRERHLEVLFFELREQASNALRGIQPAPKLWIESDEQH